MPMPHQEMRRLIKRRLTGTTGTERIKMLRAFLAELPGYYQGPYGELRKWLLAEIDATRVRRSVQHRDQFAVPKEGAAQVVLVGPPNAGKSSLLRALTGRPVPVGNYPFTTLRPAAGIMRLGGAPVQLVDLPGLAEGDSGADLVRRQTLSVVRAADAVLCCVPAEPEGFPAALDVAEEVRAAGIEVPAAVLLTKADLPGAGQFLAEAAAALAPLTCVACSPDRGANLDAVRELAWSLLGLVRVYPRRPGLAAEEAPVVLPAGATVEDFVRALDTRWVAQFRGARVTGPSARFAGQPAGLHYVLADGDIVELQIR